MQLNPRPTQASPGDWDWSSARDNKMFAARYVLRSTCPPRCASMPQEIRADAALRILRAPADSNLRAAVLEVRKTIDKLASVANFPFGATYRLATVDLESNR